MTFAKEIEKAKLLFEGKEYTFPVLAGSENEKAIDIRKLRQETGLISYDPGFGNTGACESNITFIDGEKGILRHRGYDIEDLAENYTFLDVAYLLVHGFLPTADERINFSELMNRHSMVHEDMRHFYQLYPDHAHPMAILSAMVVSLSTFYPELDHSSEESVDMMVTRLLSKVRTLAAFSYQKTKGNPIVYPRRDFKYCENFLNMMFYTPVNGYVPDPEIAMALDKLLILQADHEQNCSSNVVKGVGSTGANLYASISAGICALWGPLHGGANQQVIEMLESIYKVGNLDVDYLIDRAKDKNDSFRLFGFGHRVYKSYDPRAKVAKKVCMAMLKKMNRKDPLVDIAQRLEEKALTDPYFQERNLYPNIDFYTGLTYRAIGIPTNMFTVMFAIGRLPGWIAQWLEMHEQNDGKVYRPRQIYVGPRKRDIHTRKIQKSDS
ncbi:MAG: citrate synthase [Lentisphaeria bacterium]